MVFLSFAGQLVGQIYSLLLVIMGRKGVYFAGQSRLNCWAICWAEIRSSIYRRRGNSSFVTRCKTDFLSVLERNRAESCKVMIW